MIGGGQYGEDPILLDYFKDTSKGFLVDAGAADGAANSNSIRLLELGWSGVLVEPEPGQFAALAERWKDRPDIACVNCALGTVEGEAALYCSGQVSTLDPAWRDRCIAAYKVAYTEARVRVRRLESVLAERAAPAPLDFLSVDCEGRCRDVLESAGLDRYRPRLIVVEGSGSYLAGRGYRQIPGTRGNRFWEREDNGGCFGCNNGNSIPRLSSAPPASSSVSSVLKVPAP